MPAEDDAAGLELEPVTGCIVVAAEAEAAGAEALAEFDGVAAAGAEDDAEPPGAVVEVDTEADAAADVAVEEALAPAPRVEEPMKPPAEPFARAPSWKTLKELIAQYALLKACGLLLTYSSHVGASLLHSASVVQALPAQSPQKVVSKMSCISLK